MENNRPLGWTTVEESKLIVDAGLDPNTADMSYNWVECRVCDGNAVEDWLLRPFPIDDRQPYEQLPCWSIGALIVLIPRTININYSRFHFYMSYNNTEKWSAVYEDFVFRRQLFCSAYPSLLELLINVILWLLQNNQIKKHE